MEANASQAHTDPAASLGRAGGYELLVELAAGGMATVYLGRAVDGRQGGGIVAVKKPHRHLSTEKSYVGMLIDEARLASAIDHPNVVKVRELGFDGGEPFIVMDYVEGASLSELRKELVSVGRAVDTRIAVRVILDALAGLHAAHTLRDDAGRTLGIVHRDVSPHNVLLGCDGRSRLTDFGIAKAEDRIQTTRTHEVKGKLAYLAPERIDKRRVCTAQSDVFSAAIVFWECIAGRRLFRGEEALDTLQEILSAPIPRLGSLGANVPEALDDVLERGLSRDLETRYRSAADFADAIERAAGENIATHADVGRMIEAVFGPRLRVRHEKIREAVTGDAAAILASSGLPAREPPTPEMLLTDTAVLEAFSPLAPSGRYAFEPIAEVVRKTRKRPWGIAIGVTCGAIVGATIAVSVVSHRAPAEPAPTTAASGAVAAPSGIGTENGDSPGATTRRVVVPLPFVATRVSFDDVARDLSPASDVATFEIPLSSGVRHRVEADALDGTRAEGFVLEEDGLARVEAAGFTFESPPTIELPSDHSSGTNRGSTRKTGNSSSPAAATQPSPIGKVKNGFTKLP